MCDRADGAAQAAVDIATRGPAFASTIVRLTMEAVTEIGVPFDEYSRGYVLYFQKVYAPSN